MSEENVEIIRRSVEAFNRADLETLDVLTSEDFDFSPYLATLIEATTYRGHEGLRQYYEDAQAAWEEIQVRIDDPREVRDGVLYFSGELYGRGRASGLEVRVPLAWIAEIHDGKVTSLRSYQSEAEALEAAGLQE
jgi:ketosteroid isomerase-like protein